MGTSTLAICAVTLAATYRYYDPYGNPVGTAPRSWPGLEAFVGGTADAVTGLESDPTGALPSFPTPGGGECVAAFPGERQGAFGVAREPKWTYRSPVRSW